MAGRSACVGVWMPPERPSSSCLGGVDEPARGHPVAERPARPSQCWPWRWMAKATTSAMAQGATPNGTPVRRPRRRDAEAAGPGYPGRLARKPWRSSFADPGRRHDPGSRPSGAAKKTITRRAMAPISSTTSWSSSYGGGLGARPRPADLERLVAFDTTSHLPNLALIDWVEACAWRRARGRVARSPARTGQGQPAGEPGTETPAASPQPTRRGGRWKPGVA